MPALIAPNDLHARLKDLDGWELDADGKSIARAAKFTNFQAAFAFMTQVALVAEKMGHHPDWSNVYNRVDIQLSTHDAGGVTELDITLAQAIDRILAS